MKENTNKYKFYINLLIFYLKNELAELKNNLIIISKNKNMLIMFLILLPIVYHIIKIQILFGVIFCIFYLSIFILYNNILKSNHIINCKEVELNTKYMYRYSFFNIFLFVPKAKAFFLIYNFLNIIINSKMKKNEKIFLSLIFFIISFFIKIYILLIIGYSFLSIITTSNLIITYFETTSWKYESQKAKNQHIIMNCLLDNKDSVGEVDNIRIIIKNNEITFNADKFTKYFLSKVASPEKIQKAFTPEKGNIFSKKFVNDHFSWSISSPKFANKNLTKNKTSSPKINVIKEDKSVEKVECSDKYNPRLDGKDKTDYLTRSYQLKKEDTIIKEVPENIRINMQNESKYVHNSMIDDKNEKMLFSENGKFYSKENSPTVEEYTKDAKIPIYEKIKLIKEFEENNEKYLSSEEGKKEYEIYKNIIKGNKNNKNSQEFNNNDEFYENF